MVKAENNNASGAQLSQPGQQTTIDEEDITIQQQRTSERKFFGFHRLMAMNTSLTLHGLRAFNTELFHSTKKLPGLPGLVRLAHAGGRGGDPKAANFTKYSGGWKEVLTKALWGGPVLRSAILVIWQAMNDEARRKKVLCMAMLPRTAAFFYRILGLLGIKARLLTSNIAPQKRGRLVEDFNDNDDDQVLICTYSLRLAGLNLHKKSCTVVCIEPGLHLSEMQQATHRVRGWGQDEEQLVWRYIVRNTYIDHHEDALQAKQDGTF